MNFRSAMLSESLNYKNALSMLNTIRFILSHPINRKRRIGALADFIKWQCRSRMTKDKILHSWVNSSKLLVKNGDAGLTGNIYCGVHDFEEMGFLLHFLGCDDIFVDVGANMGSYTILACAVAGAKGIAFEPIPATYGRLMENVNANKLSDRVVCHNIGLGAEKDQIRFTVGVDAMNHVVADGEDVSNSISIPVDTLDDVIADDCPALMKIDVEGFESAVLKGSKQTLQNDSLLAIIMELNGSGDRYGYDDNHSKKMLEECGFAGYSYDPFSRELSPLGEIQSSSKNVIFVRDRAKVEVRLEQAHLMKVKNTEF